jgi:hypothetical protein
MKRSLFAGSQRAGFSVIELLLASCITAIILSSVCGVCFTIVRDWERKQGFAKAALATSDACSRLSDYISQALAVEIVTRFAGADAIAVNLPLDSPYAKVYAPIWSADKFRFRSGPWIIFYLSDSTGSYSRPGDILWAGTMTWSGFPASVAPDRSWSMYYDTNLGRVEGLKSLSFSVDSGGARPVVTVTAVSSYKISGVEHLVSRTRSICLRNAN